MTSRILGEARSGECAVGPRFECRLDGFGWWWVVVMRRLLRALRLRVVVAAVGSGSDDVVVVTVFALLSPWDAGWLAGASTSCPSLGGAPAADCDLSAATSASSCSMRAFCASSLCTSANTFTQSDCTHQHREDGAVVQGALIFLSAGPFSFCTRSRKICPRGAATPSSDRVAQPKQQCTGYEWSENQIISQYERVERITQCVDSFDVDTKEVDDEQQSASSQQSMADGFEDPAHCHTQHPRRRGPTHQVC